MNDFNCTSILIKLLLYADDVNAYVLGNGVNNLIYAFIFYLFISK